MNLNKFKSLKQNRFKQKESCDTIYEYFSEDIKNNYSYDVNIHSTAIYDKNITQKLNKNTFNTQIYPKLNIITTQ